MAERIKKSTPWFLVLFLFGLITISVLNFGKFSSQVVKADIATTTVTVGNSAPTWVAVYEDPASTTTAPTNAGSNVTFKGRADDPNNENWHLIICKTTGYTTTSNGSCPSCDGGAADTWATSTATADNATATITYTTQDSDAESNVWYAYACDNNVGSQMCSAVSQGTGATTAAYSPFEVNHRPNFTAVTQNPAGDPSASVSWTATSSDPDTSGGQDTVKLLVCDSQGVTGTSCNGTQLCISSLVTSNPSCSYNIPDPKADNTYAAWVYVFDIHNFAASGGAHDTNAQYTVNNVAPEVSNVTLNGGADINLSGGGEGPNGSTTVIATADVVDHNGCADISSVTVKAYPTGIGAGGCTAQNNNTCYYNISCATGTCQGNGYTATTSCNIQFWYHADPTDTGTLRVAETWKDTITAQDEALSTSTELTTGVELLSFLSLDVTTPIAYGSLAPGEISDTTNLPQTATTTTTGNTGLDTELSGTQMCTDYPTCSGNTIATSSQRYATSSVQYQNATALSGTATELELNVQKTTTTTSPQQKANYWGLQVPLGTPTGSYTGQNTYTAVKAETGDW